MIDVIPAIDIIEGKCVRLTHGDFARKKVYADDPLEVAKRFEAAGVKRLHMVDLDGARSGRPANLRSLERVASNTRLSIDFGGGIKTADDLESVFASGAEIANVGSIAVKDPETFFAWMEKYGSERILLGADSRNGNVAIDGWQTDTDIPIVDLLKNFAERGVRKAFVTDVSSDGAMAGPAIGLYDRIMTAVPQLHLIASGGVRDCGDIDELERIGCAGVIVGKAIYEGAITLEKLAKYAG